MALDMRLSFLVAGVQKGGTTALFDYLAEHPALCLPACKEAHFFDDETVDWARPDYAPYHALFEGCAPEALRGEATPIYIYWPGSLERIAAYNPAIRLILIFRDPAERAWSHWRMETLRGAETLPFAQCIREGRARVANNPHPAGAHRVHSYVERGFYGSQLTRAFRLFPSEQLLCLDSLDLTHRPQVVLRQVCDFLHISRLTDVKKRLSHVGDRASFPFSMDEDDRRHLSSIYRTDQKVLYDHIGWCFSDKT